MVRWYDFNPPIPRMSPVKEGACKHRDPSTITSAVFRWPGGERLDPPVNRVLCTGCGKEWVIGLTRPQRLRLLHLRSVGDERSPYEIGPEVLREKGL